MGHGYLFSVNVVCENEYFVFCNAFKCTVKKTKTKLSVDFILLSETYPMLDPVTGVLNVCIFGGEI